MRKKNKMEIKEKESMNLTNVCWKKSVQPPSWPESQLDLRMSYYEGLFILLGRCSL